jgi:hypothetical protein
LNRGIGRRYVGHVNQSYRRTGTPWEGRYRSTILDSDGYVLTCHRTIEANPLAARTWWRARPIMRGRTFDTTRSARATRFSAIIRFMPGLDRRGKPGRGKHGGKHIAPLFEDRLDEKLVVSIRDATQRGCVAGSERFRTRSPRCTAEGPWKRRAATDRQSSQRQNRKSSCHSDAQARVKRSSRQNDSGFFFSTSACLAIVKHMQYRNRMNDETISLRISKIELEALRARARAEGVSQGSLVRRALKAYGVTVEAPKAKSGYEVIKRFLGRSRGGSKDLSTNPKHLAGYGR